MGKTSLAAKLTQKLATATQAFVGGKPAPLENRIIWQSLRNAPPLDKILLQLMAILSRQQQPEPADTVDAQISQLMAYLRVTRCLLVFDNFESILAQHPAHSATSQQHESAGYFTLQPVVMEYVTAKFIDLVCEEITSLDVAIFNSHALMQAQTRDYIRESQVRMILAPLVERLLGKLRSKLEIKNQLVGVACLQDNRLLVKLRSEFTDTCGYAGGNLINLYRHLAVDLSGYDFSGLCIWQAYLLDVDLHDLNFADTNVAKSVFTETFSSIHSLAFSPDGQILASGSDDCTVKLWDVNSGQCLTSLQYETNQ